jgi:pilus assembly protein CpaF
MNQPSNDAPLAGQQPSGDRPPAELRHRHAAPRVADEPAAEEPGGDGPLRAREALQRVRVAVPLSRLAPRRVAPLAETARSGRSPAVGTVAAAAADASSASYLAVKGELHEQLLEHLERLDLLHESEAVLAEAVRQFVDDALAAPGLTLNDEERRRLQDDLLEETLGLGPLAPLLADPAVTDVLVNSPYQVYIERFGRLEATDVRFRDAQHLLRIIQRIAARVGRRIDESSPMVDARLPDGSRVNATLPPVTLDGPTLSIRRFGQRRLRRGELLQLGMFSPAMMQFLEIAVRCRCNLLISGGTGAGKSTFLGALAEAIGPEQRIITIEDAAELQLDQRHWIRMETRPPNVEGRGQITARDLLINALRMRPDRIIVGEVRSGEALDMLQAMNTGHEGSMTTIHANSPRDALSRLETMVLMAGLDLPSRAIREQIVSALDLLVHVKRYEDGTRRVESIAEITGLEGSTPQLQELFRFRILSRQGRRLQGRFEATGIVPRMVHRLQERDIDVPRSLFQPPERPE